jgi:hypothetical protein
MQMLGFAERQAQKDVTKSLVIKSLNMSMTMKLTNCIMITEEF